ncbi:MAG TPA: hypothetical protein VGD27_11375 [Longimicrobiales bacterium]
MSRFVTVVRTVAAGIFAVGLAACEADDIAFGAPEMTTVTVGDMHSCALSETGAAYCWGDGLSGQLGTGRAESSSYAVRVAGSRSFSSIDAGGRHTCALTAAGQAYCWGENDTGQLGTGDREQALEPQPVETTERFASLSAGWEHTCAITTDGRAFCWGHGAYGELGDGVSPGTATSPRPVLTALRFTQISAGGRHTCAVALGGAGYCWGANEVAQLGIGTAGAQHDVPARVDGTFSFSDISAGWNHSCGVSPQRIAYCWGENAYGEMGSGWEWLAGEPAQPSPGEVTSYGEIMFVQISAGKGFTCGRRDQGTVYCWGKGTHGQLGNGLARNFLTAQWVKGGPGRLDVFSVDIFQKVDAGSDSHACAAAVDGRVFCWGNGASGQLGNGEWLSMIALPVLAAR